MPPTIQFQEIPIGQFFEFRGRRYKKLALSMASDEERNGNIFQGQTEVLPDPLPSANPPPQVLSLSSRTQNERWGKMGKAPLIAATRVGL